MTDRWMVIAAVLMAGGAYWAEPLPLWWLLVGGLITFGWRRPWMAAVTMAAMVSTLSAESWAALDAPLPDVVDGSATFTSDPTFLRGGGVEARVRTGERLFVMRVPSEQAYLVRDAAAGYVVHLSGTVQPLTERRAPALRRRHVAGIIDADAVAIVSRGGALHRATNAVRHNLVDGARSLEGDDAALLTGFVVGDDRRLSAETRQAFEESGLLHLTAVSGANVAFLLIVFWPLLQRFHLLGRYLGALLVLAVFGVVTRWEPSVVRAEAMAAVVLTGQYLGRPITAARVLALAVIVSLLCDPFLVGSIGFLLSIGACIGMAVLGERLANRVPGPQWWGRLVGYSLAAQVGVAPVHLVIFGPMPIAALPANVLAEPVAGLIMIWGVCAGSVAGVVGDPLATVLHWPTMAMTSWVAGVARTTAALELGHWDWPLLATITGLAWLWPRRSSAAQTQPLI